MIGTFIQILGDPHIAACRKEGRYARPTFEATARSARGRQPEQTRMRLAASINRSGHALVISMISSCAMSQLASGSPRGRSRGRHCSARPR